MNEENNAQSRQYYRRFEYDRCLVNSTDELEDQECDLYDGSSEEKEN